MSARKRSDLELPEDEFARLLQLCDVLDEVQLLRLQCKVSSLIGDPPESTGPVDLDTVPPPSGLGGPYTSVVESSYEELADVLEPDDAD